MEPNEYNENNHLIELSDSDYEIVEGEPDITGWDVRNEQGQKIGEVDDLLFEPVTNKVRYIIVDLDDNELELDDDKKILIPIGVAELYESEDGEEEEVDEDDEDAIGDENNSTGLSDNDEVHHETVIAREPGAEDRIIDEDGDTEIYDNDLEGGVYDPAFEGDVVIVPATLAQLRQLPAYEAGNVNPENEMIIRTIFNGSGIIQPDYNRTDFYNHDHFNENRFYNRDEGNTNTTDPVLPRTENKINEDLDETNPEKSDLI